MYNNIVDFALLNLDKFKNIGKWMMRIYSNNYYCSINKLLYWLSPLLNLDKPFYCGFMWVKNNNYYNVYLF